MKTTTKLQSAVCLAALVAGGTAQADVTAAQVWEDWKSQMTLYGDDSVSIGGEETSGGTLTVRDLAVDIEDPELTVSAQIGDLVFEEQRNGTVKVTMDESYPITLTGVDGVVVTLTVAQDALEMIVSGDPGAMNYEISANSYSISLDEVVDGDITFTGDAQIVANDLTSVYNTTTSDLRNVAYEGSVSSIDLLVDIQIPGGNGEYVTGGGKIENMALNADMSLPVDANFDDPDTMIVDGFSFAGGYSLDNSAYIFDINAEGDQASGSISTGATSLEAEVNADVISYNTSTTDVAANISASELPFPVEVGLSEYGVGFEMPTSKSDTPSDFGLSLDFIDLTLNDMVWNLFDPGSVLPRDPATIQFSLAGLAKPLFDLMDPAQQAQIDASEMPFELAELSLENLRIAAAGALVTGTGAFTFDNSDMQSFAPLPKPEGDVVVEISGLNRLIDNLISMGLVSQEDAMAPRMMMGMFARSTGDDRLETKLEVTADGRVLANGQQIR
ncbi:DUF2125 domain-containing protein [Cognatiyoonia sp. IB215446]|uniref:DUF2125 domain-containing protein n=1 Tax=Cognatiyoonia sp. IB215446 TaxID=3097355 RepID=UPI002A0E3BB7|nr:DUF2125 domain-containing protein [Cognatiyoonia sp. IB215446]MDX8350378.1 DUF2125 domain-containing protein [Cognatiyoonia sp. IB215446]